VPLQRGVPTHIRWTNDLKTALGAYQPHILRDSIDQTIHWANPAVRHHRKHHFLGEAGGEPFYVTCYRQRASRSSRTCILFLVCLFVPHRNDRAQVLLCMALKLVTVKLSTFACCLSK
jgi:hypothetical protein